MIKQIFRFEWWDSFIIHTFIVASNINEAIETWSKKADKPTSWIRKIEYVGDTEL